MDEDVSSQDIGIGNIRLPENEQQIIRSVVEVEFKRRRRMLFRNDDRFSFRCAEYVVVEVENGKDLGVVINCQLITNRDEIIENYSLSEPPKYKIIRLATSEDINNYIKIREDEIITLQKVKEFVKKHSLKMKVTDAEWQFDMQRLTIYFTASNRIDFRQLVRELAWYYQTRIELRQINTRQETKRMGNGVGPCGQEVCCCRYLNDFKYITIDHAKIQQLPNNLTKLSGNCGRLKCCLLYEYETYAEEIEKLPSLDSIVQIPEGVARMIKVDIFKELVYLYVDSQKKQYIVSFQALNDLLRLGKVVPPEASEDNNHDLYYDDGINLREAYEIDSQDVVVSSDEIEE